MNQTLNVSADFTQLTVEVRCPGTRPDGRRCGAILAYVAGGLVQAVQLKCHQCRQRVVVGVK